jgi:putative flippase GtrA
VTSSRHATGPLGWDPGWPTQAWGGARDLVRRDWLLQVVRFAVVGVSNTLVDALLYFALTRWLGLAALPILAKTISYGAGVLNSFYWNRVWTFRSHVANGTGLLSFALINILALGVNAGVMVLALQVLDLPELAALVAATGVTFVWNFTLSKLVVFRR